MERYSTVSNKSDNYNTDIEMCAASDKYVKQLPLGEVMFSMYKFEEEYNISSFEFNKLYESGQYDVIDSKDAAVWNLCCVSCISSGISLQVMCDVSQVMQKLRAECKKEYQDNVQRCIYRIKENQQNIAIIYSNDSGYDYIEDVGLSTDYTLKIINEEMRSN